MPSPERPEGKPPDGPAPFDLSGGTDARAQGHRMLDDLMDHLERLGAGPVWRPLGPEDRSFFKGGLPEEPMALHRVHADFMERVLPFSLGNPHPRFMGWVHGGGTVPGMLAEMLAGGLNSNCGGRDHAAIEVERQVVDWLKQLFGFPDSAGGLMMTGTSGATLVALLVARRAALGPSVREAGLGEAGARLVAYASEAAHGCFARAMDHCGLGTGRIRRIPVDADHRVRLDLLREAVALDLAAGLRPFLLVGTAGTVDIGACDDLTGLGEVAKSAGMWFHVDGAIGALGLLSPEIAPRLAGMERADSLALDFHKWGQVPYDAGCVLIRDGGLQRATFAASAGYLERRERGLAAGDTWPVDLGPDLSRGFRALKVWFTLRTFGTRQLGAMITQTCGLARHLQARVEADARLELLAPVPLNIVCFRFRGPDPEALNAAIVEQLHERGIAAPSTTRIGGRLAIRAAIFNHRTRQADLDALLDGVLRLGAELAGGPPGP